MDYLEVIKKYIRAGEFLKTKPLVKELTRDELKSVLFAVGYDENNIVAYAYILFLIQQEESIERHQLASLLLDIAFCQLEGAYQAALYHTRKTIEMDPSDITLKENLLFYNRIPEKVLSDEEAALIVKEIIEMNPTSEVALDNIKWRNKKE